jgi:hypothetical protein
MNPGVSLWFRPSACTRVDHGHAAHYEAQPNVPLGNVDSEEAFDELALMNSHHMCVSILPFVLLLLQLNHGVKRK